MLSACVTMHESFISTSARARLAGNACCQLASLYTACFCGDGRKLTACVTRLESLQLCQLFRLDPATQAENYVFASRTPLNLQRHLFVLLSLWQLFGDQMSYLWRLRAEMKGLRAFLYFAILGGHS